MAGGTITFGATAPNDMVLSEDGTRLYVAGADGRVRAYDAETGALLSEWTVAAGKPLGGLALSIDGSFLVTAERTATSTLTAHRIEVATGAVTTFSLAVQPQQFYDRGPLTDVAILADGRAYFTQGEQQFGYVSVLDFGTGAFATLGLGPTPYNGNATATADGGLVLLSTSALSSPEMYLYRPGDGVVATRTGYPDGVVGYAQPVQAISGEAGLIATVVNRGELLIYDLSLKLVAKFKTVRPDLNESNFYPVGLAFSSDGSSLFAMNSNRSVVEFSTRDWSTLQTITIATAYADTGLTAAELIVGPDDRYLLLRTGSGLVRVDNPRVANDQVGGNGADTLAGGDAADVLVGGDGSDALTGGGGRDVLYGGAGDDTLRGGDGDDALKGGLGSDLLEGGNGDDVLEGGGGADLLDGGAGNDTASFARSGSAVTISLGQAGAQALANGASVRLIGVENLVGSGQADRLTGDETVDRLTGGLGDDVIDGRGGDDAIAGGAGKDVLSGGDGADRIDGDGGDDLIEGDAGADRLNGGAGADVVRGGAGDDVVEGGAGNDTLSGGAGDDTVAGGDGVDLIRGSAGRDQVDGGLGADRLEIALGDAAEFAPATGPRAFTVSNGRIAGSGGLFDTGFTNVEVVRLDLRGAGAFGDAVDGSGYTLTSEATRFEFLLGDGDDVVTGTAARDRVVAGRGALTADGGAGVDAAVLPGDGSGATLTLARAGDAVTGAQNGVRLYSLRGFEGIQVRAADPASTTGLSVDATGLDQGVVLVDSAGRDTFRGGLGADTFFSDTASDRDGQADSYTGGGGRDFFDFSYAAKAMDGTTITDLDADDQILLDSDGPATDGFNLPIGDFIGRAGFTGVAGEVRYDSDAGRTFLQVDANGDRVADATLTIGSGAWAIGEFQLTPANGAPYRYFAIRTDIAVTNGTAASDTVRGGAGADELGGLAGDDLLDGAGGDDFLYGGAGNDRLVGGAGDDCLTGDAGTDTAVFSGGYRRYSVLAFDDYGLIDGPDGEDLLLDVERFEFIDGVFTVDPESAGAQVQRMYDTVLGRAPDLAGLDHWVDRMEDAGATLVDVANAFADSPEFRQATGGLGNPAFVDYVYAHALGRAPDAGGRDHWIGKLDGGLSRGEMLVLFSETPEHRTKTADLTARGYFQSDDAAQAVALIYDTALGRRPDGAGLAFWTNEVKSGARTVAQVADAFTFTTEFQNATANTSNAQFVDYLYRNTLDREPDAGGRAHWIGKLDAGAARAELVLGFSQSPEHAALLAPLIIGGIDLV